MVIKPYIKTLDKHLAIFPILQRSQHASSTNIAALLLLSRECNIFTEFSIFQILSSCNKTKKKLFRNQSTFPFEQLLVNNKKFPSAQSCLLCLLTSHSSLHFCKLPVLLTSLQTCWAQHSPTDSRIQLPGTAVTLHLLILPVPAPPAEPRSPANKHQCPWCPADTMAETNASPRL